MRPKADYGVIADTFDIGRPMSETGIGFWGGLIAFASRAQPGASLLDLGCGTGRFAIPLARDYGFAVTGADASPEMLQQARQKPDAEMVAWEVQDADDLRFQHASFDVIMMSHVIHHVASPQQVIARCMWTLKPGGALLVRYGAIEQIEGDVEHSFFAGAIDIDRKRTPSVDQLESWLVDAGYADVTSMAVKRQTVDSPQDRLERVRAKYTSVLHLIPDDSFQAGLINLIRYIAENGDERWLITDTQTLTAGYKPA